MWSVGSGDGEVGVDIQKWVPYQRSYGRAFFCAKGRVETAAGDGRARQRTELFYRLWSRKEAYGKYTGQGIGSVSGRRLSPTSSRLEGKEDMFPGTDFGSGVFAGGLLRNSRSVKRKERESCKGIGSMKSGCALHGKREEMRTL